MSFALGWKLFVAHADRVVREVLALGIHSFPPVLAVAVLQSGMAPMISAAILADQYKLEPRVANATLGVGILISLVTIPLLNLFV